MSYPAQADVAVVIQTVLRPTLERAVDSVFAQQFGGRIHLLIGVDVVVGDPARARAMLAALQARCPAHVEMTIINPGYSTSARHGGPHSNFFGGSLRTILTLAAKSAAVAYLDDDDWYAPDHLASLRTAMQGRAWAFSLSWYVNPWTLEPMCIDAMESVGPDAGVYGESQGGFVRPSCLMLDKLQCGGLLYLWSMANSPRGDGEDRLVFGALCKHYPEPGRTERASVHYLIKPTDPIHPVRVAYLASQGYDVSLLERTDPYVAPRI